MELRLNGKPDPRRRFDAVVGALAIVDSRSHAHFLDAYRPRGIIHAVQLPEAFIIELPDRTVAAAPGAFLVCGLEGELYAVAPEQFRIAFEKPPR